MQTGVPAWLRSRRHRGE